MADIIRKKILKIILAAMVLAAFQGINVQASDMMGHPVMENVIKPPEIIEGKEEGTARYGTSYPKVYDPRKNGKVTSVKDQGQYNNCWAFSVMSAIESNLVKKGITDNTIDLSENHLMYYFYNRKTDSLNYTKNDKNIALRDKWNNNGGNMTGAALSLVTWAGVTKESNSRYLSTPKKNICYNHEYAVKNYYSYKYSVNTIKQAITDHGAVATGMYIDMTYFNSQTGAYYCSRSDINHGVAIVGWDDNYSRNNFNFGYRPNSDGAWIVKNSYGTAFGDKGFMYISYEDKSLSEIIAFDMVRKKNSYDNNYQHDGSASSVYSYNLSDGIKVSNVFKAKATGKYVETLKAVSVNTYTTNARYYLQIYTGLTDLSDPESGKAMFSKPQTGILKEAGYSQISLKKPVALAAGENFSVVFRFSSSENSVKIGVDSSYNASWIKFQAYAGKKKSFINSGYYWSDFGAMFDSIFRIKAFTDNTKTIPKYKISNKKLSLTKGKSVKLSLKVTPASVKRSVSWYSSNKKVAKVSSNGTVKGCSAGTAVIKAKFMAGGSAKVLECRVTVKPSVVKGFRTSGGKGVLSVSWKPDTSVKGYKISYADKKNGVYKRLKMITAGRVKNCSIKMKRGRYYIKMCAYAGSGSDIVYGNDTGARLVRVK